MKKLLFLILLFFPLMVNAVSAEAYAVMDYDSGRILMSKNENREKLIASTTKIMTAIIALEKGDLNSVRTVGEEVLKAYGSAIYIEMNEKITLKDLLYGLMLRSGNDAAIEIAYHVSGDMESFVEAMNEKAYELGMSHTKFYNNHGLEEEDGMGNTSTAYDMALLMRYALRNDMFREIIGTKNYTAKTNTKTYVWYNKNKLRSSFAGACGVKTGYTVQAGRCLVSAAEREGALIVCVVLDCPPMYERSAQLLEAAFSRIGEERRGTEPSCGS